MKTIYAIITCLLLSLSQLKAQAPPGGIVTVTSNIPNLICGGLSSFVIDNTGNKWLGFNNSSIHNPQLMRYNGNVWDTFPHIPGKKVNALAVDALNNIWVGGNAGLTKFDGITYTTFNRTNSTIISDTIISLTFGNGNVYIGTYKGLSVFNGTTFTNYTRASNGMKSDTVYCITVESANTIWLGNQYGLDKFTGTNFTYYSILNGANAKVNCVYIDPQNNKWIGTATDGAIRYDNINFVSELDFIGGWPTLLELTCGIQGGGGSGPLPMNINSICQGSTGGVFINRTQILP